MKIIGTIVMVVFLFLLEIPVSGEIIYSQAFDTNTTDLLSTYGFSSVGGAVSYFATNGQALWTGSGGYYMLMWRQMPAGFVSDWTRPLVLTADLASQNTGGGQSYGILLGAGTGQPGDAGLSFNLYWPSSVNGGWASYANGGGTRSTINANPDVTAGTDMWNLTMTIRENTDDAGKFDVKLQVNGTNQWGSDGWSNGFSKAAFGIDNSNPFGTFGIRGDGLSVTQRLDNLTLSVLPVSRFTPSETNGVILFNVTFTDISTGNFITNRHWDFGDGQTLDTAQTNVVHDYTTGGNLTVTLTVYDNAGSSSSSAELLVERPKGTLILIL